MSSEKRPGFTLTEPMLAVTITLIVLSIMKPSGDRVVSNEIAAIAALRSITSAQAQLASSGAIDSDGDGVGEYGYLGELAGTAPLRVHDPVADAPALDANGLGLCPPLVPPAFGNIVLQADGEAELELHGYRFKMYLPDVTLGDDHIAGIPETGPNGIGGATAGKFPEPDNCEVLWACYAWPHEDQVTGHRVFFVDQDGLVLQTRNDPRSPATVLLYDGPRGGPAYDAAYSVLPASPDAPTGMGAPPGSPPRKASDGNLWTPVGRP